MRDESTYGGALNDPVKAEPVVQGAYYGVHGWLKFLVVMNLYVVPVLFVLSYIGALADYFAPSYAERGSLSLVLIRGLGGLFFTIWGILVARQLRDIKPRSVQKYKTLLIASGVFLAFSTSLTYQIDPDLGGAPFYATVIAIIVVLIPTFIWYRYFCVSKRVKATYPDWNE